MCRVVLRIKVTDSCVKKGQKQSCSRVGARKITAPTVEAFHHLWTFHYLLKLYGSRWG